MKSESVQHFLMTLVLLVDRQNVVTEAAPEAEALLGYRPEELAGRSSGDIVDRTDRPALEHALAQARAGEKPPALAISLRRRNGSRVALRMQLHYSPRNEIVICTCRPQSPQYGVERELKKIDQRYHSLFAMNPDPVFEFDLSARLVHANPACERVSGYTREELIGMPMEAIVVPEHIMRARQQLRDAAAGLACHYEIRCQHRDGSIFELAVTNIPIIVDGCVVGVYGVAKDISARNRRETEIRLAFSALNSMAEAVIITNAQREIIWANPAFTTITGFTPREAIGQRPRLIDASEDEYPNAAAIAATAGRWQGELVCRRQGGDLFTSLVSMNAVRERGKIINYVDVLTDISALKNYQNRVDFLVSHDPLTRLPGRSLFEHDLAVAVEQARVEHKTLGVVVVGLDSFKMINDSLGHKTGDALLREVAKRMTGNLREIDIVSRLTGDQFAIMLADAGDPDNIGLVVNKLFKKLAQPFVVHGDQLFVTASAGISCYPKDGADAATLTKNADAAMYQAKRRGRNIYHFYDPGINRKVHDNLRIANNLRRAAERDEFVLHYQPCINLGSGEIVGVEALMRWQHPKLGLILPDRFISLAEDTGLIRPLGDWALETACRQAVAWQQAGYKPLRFAVNLSVSQFRQPDLVRRVRNIVERTGIAPECLELEITESMIMEDPATYQTVIGELNAMGMTLSIDDFGTGYSSLSYLRDLPVNALKIDKSFVAGIPTDDHQTGITRAIISMAQTLGKRIIAEGIETDAQLDFLRSQGCDEGQGFLISRPQRAERMEAMLGGGEPPPQYHHA